MPQYPNPLDALRKAQVIGPPSKSKARPPVIGPNSHAGESLADNPLEILRHAQSLQAVPPGALDWQPPTMEPGANAWTDRTNPQTPDTYNPPPASRNSYVFQPPQGEGDPWGGGSYVPKSSPGVSMSGLRGLAAFQPPQGEGDAWGGAPYAPKPVEARSGGPLTPHDRQSMGMSVFSSPRDIEIPAEPANTYNGPVNDPNTMRRADNIINSSKEVSPPVQALQSIGADTYKRPPVQTPDFGSGMQANNPLQLSQLRDVRAGELEDRLAAGEDPRAAELLKFLGRDIAEDPYTGTQAQAIQADTEAKRRSAIEQGYSGGAVQGHNYGDPVQEANAAARAAEEYKVDAPVRAQQTAGQYDLAKQQSANEGALGVANVKADQYEALLNMMNAANAGGRDVSHFSMPGGGGITYAPQQQVPTQLLQDVQSARTAMEKSDWGAGPTAASRATFNQTVQNALVRWPFDDSTRAFLSEALNTPEYRDMGLDAILASQGIQPDDLDPESYQGAKLFMSAVRGK